MFKITIFLVLLLEVQCVAESLDFNVDEMRVQGNANDRVAIVNELKDFLNNEIVEKATGISEIKSRIHASLSLAGNSESSDEMSTGTYILNVRSDTVRKETLDLIGKKLSVYVQLRIMGHTAGYASWIAWSGLNQFPEHILKEHPWIRVLSNEIAYQWIVNNIADTPCLAYPSMERSGSTVVVVVDGELAWVYPPNPSNTYQIGNRACFDSLEFNLGLKNAFADVKAEWKKRHVRSKTTLKMWAFFEDILRRKYHILWRSPSLLNPGTIYD